MSTLNVTLDDFDSLVVYSDQTQWRTPNPQDNPSWAVTPSANPTQWHQGTYHASSTPGATVAVSFEASKISVYGASGPSYGNYSVSIDGSSQTFSAYAASNSSERHLLYTSPDGLTYVEHTLELTVLSDDLLVDLFVLHDVVFGSSGATLKNTTLQESSSEITYTGSWTTNSDPLFSGGGSTYTSTAGDALEFSFEGSALYITGDVVNDHGPFSVTINETSSKTLSGSSGCGGVTGKNCEKLGVLEFFESNLPAGTHRVKLTNLAGERPYFDLDSIIFTTPSSYAVAVANGTPSSLPSSSISGSASRSSSVTASGATSPSASASTAASGASFSLHRARSTPLLAAVSLLCLFEALAL